MRDPATVSALNEWSDWVRSGLRGGPAKVRSWWGPMVTDPNMGAGDGWGRRFKQQVNEDRAALTDAAVKSLDHLSRQVIWQHYIKGGSREQKAAALGFGKSTFYAMLADAEAALKNILACG